MTHELNMIWKLGYQAAINGFTIGDNPYKHDPRKHAWVLGFKAGLEIVNNPTRLPPDWRKD